MSSGGNIPEIFIKQVNLTAHLLVENRYNPTTQLGAYNEILPFIGEGRGGGGGGGGGGGVRALFNHP